MTTALLFTRRMCVGLTASAIALTMALTGCGTEQKEKEATATAPATNPATPVINAYWDSVLTHVDSLSPCLEQEVSESMLPVEVFDPTGYRVDGNGFVTLGEDHYCLLQMIMKGHYLRDANSPVRILKGEAGTWLVKNLRDSAGGSPLVLVLLRDKDFQVYMAEAEDRLDSSYVLKPADTQAGLLVLHQSRRIYGSGGGMSGQLMRVLDLDRGNWVANVPVAGQEEGFPIEGEHAFQVAAQRPWPKFSQNGTVLEVAPASFAPGKDPAAAGPDYDPKQPDQLMAIVFQELQRTTSPGRWVLQNGQYKPAATASR